jgi:K+-sensing histidine kinase KdpD
VRLPWTQQAGGKPAGPPRLLREIAVALGLVTLATAVRLALHPLLEAQYTTAFFVVAVVGSAYIDGTRGAIIATLFSWLALFLFIVSPLLAIHPFRLADVVGSVVFLASGLAIAFLSGRMNWAQRRAEQLANEREAEVQELTRQLRLGERMAQVGTLAAGITHDIANVLLPMRARLLMLSSRDPTDAVGVTRDIERVRAFADYLGDIARGLNEMVADPGLAGAGRTVLATWLRNMLPFLRAVVPRHVELDVDLPDELPTVGIASHALSQVVFNAVQNAGKAMRDRPSGHVEVAARHDARAGTVVITITDDGPGVPAQELAELARIPPGTHPDRGVSGLGIRLMRTIIESAGGKFEITSDEASGTRVRMVLPAAPRDPGPGDPGPGDPGPGDPESDS